MPSCRRRPPNRFDAETWKSRRSTLGRLPKTSTSRSHVPSVSLGSPYRSIVTAVRVADASLRLRHRSHLRTSVSSIPARIDSVNCRYRDALNRRGGVARRPVVIVSRPLRVCDPRTPSRSPIRMHPTSREGGRTKASIAGCRNGKVIVLLLVTFGVGRAQTAYVKYEDPADATSISASGDVGKPDPNDEMPAWHLVRFVLRAPGPLVQKVDKRLLNMELADMLAHQSQTEHRAEEVLRRMASGGRK
ncbi:unnamed protein product [Darwinula stevensoni]|uniref:Uncharacterized protein n=1 Tax=Darwinula stevensoni TaxID=69355 RepID=A0A7R9A6H9_9CRUS|nr:unnamed protein product [Darwinula stevensoni]CAG0887853.1 unnamed protein product [Darwinula stevensoni]